MRALETRVAIAAVVVAVVVMAIKLVAWIVTDSDAILSDALEALVNVAASLMALGAIKIAHRPADSTHPYGHGRIEFISASIEGGMILFAAVAIVVQATGSLIGGARELANPGLGMWLIVLTGVINGVMAVLLLSIGRRTGSAALKGDGMHLLSDLITTVAVVASLMAVASTGWWWIDPAAAILIAMVLGLMGVRLVWRSFDNLMDRRDDSDQQALERLLASHVGPQGQVPRICSFHKVRSRHDGREHWIDMHVRLPAWMSVRESHDAASVLESQAVQVLGGPGDATAHCEPCADRACALCAALRPST
jgi:cation diffusion facilitator family transporter